MDGADVWITGCPDIWLGLGGVEFWLEMDDTDVWIRVGDNWLGMDGVDVWITGCPNIWLGLGVVIAGLGWTILKFGLRGALISGLGWAKLMFALTQIIEIFGLIWDLEMCCVILTWLNMGSRDVQYDTDMA